MSTFVTARNTISYREAVSATDSIETPSFGFAKPSDFQGVTPGIAVIIKQNNTEIHLLTQIAETLKEIQQELRKQNTPLPQDLISKLQNLSLGPPKPKEKPGKLRVFKDPYKILKQEQEKLKGIWLPPELNNRQYEGTMALVVFRDNRWQGDQAILATMEISILTRGYEAWQNSEANLLITRDEEILAVLIETKPGVYVYYDGEADDYYEKQKSKYKTGRWDTLGQPSGKFDYYVNYDIPEIPFFPEIPPTGWDDEVGETNNSQKEGSIATSERYSSTTEPHILVNKITPNAVMPSRQSEGSAGLDVSANHTAVIEPYGRELIHTGLRIEIPYGYYGRLASRSGLAWKTGIEVGAGVIDSDYRGEVQVLLFNRTNLPIYISPQQKIAQLILEKIAIPEVYEVPHLSYTERGNKGFGSTENQKQIIPEKDEVLTLQDPRYFTPEDIFSILMPKETTAVLVQEDSVLNNFEQDHAVDTSPGAAVPRFMEPTLNYQDLDDSYLDYIQYLSTLSGQQPPQWDSPPDSNWTNPFASEGGGRQEAFIQLNPQKCDKFIELVAANVEMEYPSTPSFALTEIWEWGRFPVGFALLWIDLGSGNTSWAADQ
ncbi:hypothetical protein ZIOFF_006317 [Zingiber officinale]|uniref:dUTP diphosphatase n=1 Tax=Zingiber officinale TaxID=94328 RepID=A0A8J5ICE8_ZINOF|nr:hypothetical protein ZIOFF_006317 [Zingiber officinale]